MLLILLHTACMVLNVDVVSIAGAQVRLSRPAFDELTDGADTTGLRLWPAAIPLAARLNEVVLPSLRRETRSRPLRLLELGAGRGLVGIALAALSADVSVVLTDDARAFVSKDGVSQSSLDVLRDNIALNTELCGGRVSAERCIWGDDADAERLRSSGKFDLIIGSDLLYDPTCYVPLLKTLSHVGSSAYIGYSRRHQGEAAFLSLADRSFDASIAQLPWPKGVSKPAGSKDGSNPFIVPLSRSRRFGGVRATAVKLLATLYGRQRQRRRTPPPPPEQPSRECSEAEWLEYEESAVNWGVHLGSMQSAESSTWRFAGQGDFLITLEPRV